MEKILIVEDSKVISKHLRKSIISNLKNVKVDIVGTFQELEKLFRKNKDFSIALVDIHLPDVNDLSLIDFLLENQIPSIVMSASFDDTIYDIVKEKNIIDFVLKDSLQSLSYIVSLTKRLLLNKNKTVLIVDDSRSSLHYIDNFLKKFMYKTILETNPQNAIKSVKNKDIQLVVTDYYMPELTGVELIKHLRKHYYKEKLGIMGISSDEKSAVHFLKYGANDFIKKPFIKEEFLHRINNLAQQQDDIFTLNNIVNTDFLTKIYNRKYFFEEGHRYYRSAKVQNKDFTVGMLDIDNFKSVNDTYGHDVGDLAIQSIANTLRAKTKGDDIVARFGGEEFIVLLKDIPFDASKKIFDSIRKDIEENKIYMDDEKYIQITVSVGITNNYENSLDDMIKTADNRLYTAKENGKNQVVYESKELVTV